MASFSDMLSRALTQAHNKREARRRRDQEIQDYINEYRNLADQFSKNLDRRIRTTQNLAVGQIKKQLSQNIQNIRGNANARGMLFSGTTAANEGRAERDASNLAGQTAIEIRDTARRQDQEYQSRARSMKHDLDTARNAVQNFDSNLAWQDALSRINDRTQAFSNIGYGAGIAASQAFPQNNPTANQNQGYFSANNVQTPRGTNIGLLGNYNLNTYGGY